MWSSQKIWTLLTKAVYCSQLYCIYIYFIYLVDFVSCLFLLQSCELTHVTLGFSHYLSSACRKNIIYKIIKIPNAKLYFSLCKYWDFGYHEGEISISVKGSNISITIVKASKILIIVIGSKISLIIKGSKISKSILNIISSSQYIKKK